MNIDLQFFLRVMAVLDNSEEIKEHMEMCRKCKIHGNNRCKKEELCINAFSKILKDHPSNITRKLNRINQYFKTIGDSIVYLRTDSEAPRNKPRKFIKRNPEWIIVLQKAENYEYQHNIVTAINFSSFSQKSDQSQNLFSALETKILESGTNIKRIKDLPSMKHSSFSEADIDALISKTPLSKLIRIIEKKQKRKKKKTRISHHFKKKEHRTDKTNYEKRPPMYMKHKPT